MLLVEMLMNYLNVAANFPALSLDVVQRVVDLLRVCIVMAYFDPSAYGKTC